jgi:hypothetical protein
VQPLLRIVLSVDAVICQQDAGDGSGEMGIARIEESV